MEFLEYIDYIMGPSDFLILISSAAAMGATLFIKKTGWARPCGDGPEPQDGHAAWHQYGRIISLTFIIGSALGALAACWPRTWAWSISALVLFAGMKAFTAAVPRRHRSIPGAMVGGLVLGPAESQHHRLFFGNYEAILALPS